MAEPANLSVLSHSTPITIAMLVAFLSLAFFAGVIVTRLVVVEGKAQVADVRMERIEEAIILLKEVSTDNKRRLDEMERRMDRERNQP